jgi:adenosine deaminase
MVVAARARVKKSLVLMGLLAAGCGPATGAQDLEATELGLDAICTPSAEGSAACKREAQMAELFDGLRDEPELLADLLLEMPKGGDLHSHLSGAVDTEHLIGWAIDDGLCVDAAKKVIKCKTSSGKPVPGAVKAASVPKADLVAAWSMEGFDGTVQEGHDHFFATFGRFGLVTRTRTADMIAAVRTNAAAQGEQYLELMLAFGTSKAGSLAQSLLGDDDAWDADSIRAARATLAADGAFGKNLDAGVAELDAAVKGSDALLGCESGEDQPGCRVQVRYIVQVWRASSRESVLGQIVYGYELALRDPRVVGLNLAAAEDDPTALGTYEDVMLALGVLRDEYPADVHVSLHAGELVPELFDDPEEQANLRFHIREAVMTARAERIGHGIDILGEQSDDLSSEALRQVMRERGVAVEVCRASNRFILGVGGAQHPMAAYLASGVPVVIATDDEGVSRSSLSEELTGAVLDHGLDYRTTKAMARSSMAHAFLPGASLFEEEGDLACSDCAPFLAKSERARLQLELERALAQFEEEATASD